LESLLDGEYAALIPDDSVLLERFEEHLRSHPFDFAPCNRRGSSQGERDAQGDRG
jgi:hypothetical protein